VSIVGSTGSIGTQAIDVIRADPDRYSVVALGANRSVDALAEQARILRPQRVAIADATLAGELISKLPEGIEMLAGPDSLAAIAHDADVVLNAVVGFAGLPVTLAALEAGARLALANKESLIAAGPVVQRARATHGAEIVPVDSEHCAIHQCLRSSVGAPEVSRIILTASGGPFRGRTRDELADVTPEQALAHPNFSMGRVITTNSATLVNKGLEVIEAHLLFDVPMDRIDVVVHPQSVVHSMVEFVDGSTILQASPPTMLIPIALGLDWPDRIPDTAPPVDWTRANTWEFLPLDDEAFPAVRLARDAGTAGGTAPAVYNAANEVAVEAFRTGRLRFVEIVDVVADVVGAHPVSSEGELTVEDVLDADAWARAEAARRIEGSA